MLDMYRTKKDQLQRVHNFAKLVQVGLRNLARLHGTSNPPFVIVERWRGPATVQVSLPPFFINEHHSFLPSLRDLQRCRWLRGRRDPGRNPEGHRRLTLTDGAHNEEDPDADIDELDFFSDED